MLEQDCEDKVQSNVSNLGDEYSDRTNLSFDLVDNKYDNQRYDCTNKKDDYSGDGMEYYGSNINRKFNSISNGEDSDKDVPSDDLNSGLGR